MDDAVRQQILDAAEAVVLRDGHDRLRITAIARQLGMSHANIYRYFENRQALVEAVAAKHLRRSLQVVRDVVEGPGSVAERLEGCFVAMAQHKLSQVADGSHQVAAMVLEAAPPLAAQHFQQQHAQIVRLLAEGVADGGLRTLDPDAVAATVIDAATAIYHPGLVARSDPSTLLARARALARLLLQGLEQKT
ncbi:MAG: TetR/AcrR family transcriptional regulator [Myxococcota bacterium]